MSLITPIEKINNIYFKREDYFNVYGANGAKARSCYHLVKKAKDDGFKIITTAGSRKSPQINIVAQICEHLGLEFVAHCPMGVLGDELLQAQSVGAKIIQHKAGYNNVIIARCREFAKVNNGFEVPFGMMCDEAINQTKNQVVNIPKDIKRIVLAVGSGMNLSGLLHGLKENNIKIPVLGVVVGANPTKTLNKFAPTDWESMVTLVNAGVDYHKEIKENVFNNILLDPIYEAKCIKFLEPNDLFWIIGIRRSLLTEQELNSYVEL